ncbi:MAG TPA: histidine triad nucleotide-binding protein [Acidimicrobiales bacterium]|nr:histidine triad nucleotide-binding protein [Acidimicrobiales bacterium]
MTTDPECLFCGIVAGDVPADVVRRDERTVAFRDIAPQAPVHVLVVPRNHIVNAGTVGPDDADDVAALLMAARAVADAEGIGGEDRGYRLTFNVGPDASNTVPHLHLHLLGGRSFDWPPG